MHCDDGLVPGAVSTRLEHSVCGPSLSELAICLDLLYSFIHGAHFCSRLVLHKLHSYTRTHIKAASFLRHLKYNERRNALR